MASNETFKFTKAATLVELNKVVSQNEDIVGPLVRLGNDGSWTLLTFDMDQDPPINHAVVAVIPVQNAPPVPAGSKKVAHGKVFIDSILTNAIATRSE